MRIQAVILMTVGVLLAIAQPAIAQSVVSDAEREAIRGVPDRWGFGAGSYWQTFDARFRLDGTNGETGTEIEIEETLRLPEDQANLQVSAFYRFSGRHRIDLSYVGWDRSRTATLDREIQWGDVIYDVGATVSTRASGDLLDVIYKYSFFNNGKVVFGVNGGISVLWTQTSLSGEGTLVGGGGTVAQSIVESEGTFFPVPVVGVHFQLTLAERLFWDAEGSFFAGSVAGYDGNVNRVATGLTYYVTRNLGIGAGFATTGYRVETDADGDADIRVRYGFDGVVAVAKFAF